MPHVIEPSPSARATCRACGRKIAAGERRFGERLPNPYDDEGGEMTRWFHLACAAFARPESFLETLPRSEEPIENRTLLEDEARLGMAHRRLPRVRQAERASSGRAACRSCRKAIEKGAWRIALAYYEEGRFVPSGFIHVRCVPSYLETTAVMTRLRHFSPTLADTDLREIAAELDAARA